MPSDLLAQIVDMIAKFQTKIEAHVPSLSTVRGATGEQGFREAELSVHAEARALADAIMGAVLQARVGDLDFEAEASLAARRALGLRNGGRASVKVSLLGGLEVRLETEYLKPNRRGGRAVRRGNGRRGKGGVGVYPVLAALGIWFNASPALASDVARQVADSDSVRAGRAALDQRGADLGHKETLRLVNKVAARAVEQRARWFAAVMASKPTQRILAGKRVVVATDGGRLRLRCPARHGRRRKDTGHRRYDAPWCEPKLLTIYVVDGRGKVSDTFRPFYDGTLGDADAVFRMLLAYLKALGADEARELIVLGDGARWIWDRVADLVKDLGIPSDRVTQVVDWCHALGTLHKIVDLTSWSASQRAAWIVTAKSLLHRGRIKKLDALIADLVVDAPTAEEHRLYFSHNAQRMQYSKFKAANIPTGSGAIESAVRRIVNMRMKSNGTFWLEDNAEGMLLLRSYLKGGYFDALLDWSLAQATPWWPASSSTMGIGNPLGLHAAA